MPTIKHTSSTLRQELKKYKALPRFYRFILQILFPFGLGNFLATYQNNDPISHKDLIKLPEIINGIGTFRFYILSKLFPGLSVKLKKGKNAKDLHACINHIDPEFSLLDDEAASVLTFFRDNQICPSAFDLFVQTIIDRSSCSLEKRYILDTFKHRNTIHYIDDREIPCVIHYFNHKEIPYDYRVKEILADILPFFRNLKELRLSIDRDRIVPQSFSNYLAFYRSLLLKSSNIDTIVMRKYSVPHYYKPENWETDLERIGDKLPVCSNVKTFIFNNALETKKAVDAFSQILNKLPNLEKIDLNESRLKSVEILNNYTKLTSINLSCSEIGRFNFQSLVDLVLRCKESLQELYLNSIYFPKENCQNFADALAQCSELTTLHIAANNITNETAIALGRALSKCHKFKNLNIGYNSIDSESIVILVSDLVKCPQLEGLDLGGMMSCSIINDITALKLANLLAGSHSFTKLGLTISQISIQAIKEILIKCKNLYYLGVNGCRVSFEELKGLAPLVAQLPKLTDLGISNAPEELSINLLKNKRHQDSSLMLLLCAARNRRTKGMRELPPEVYSHMFATFFNNPPGTKEDAQTLGHVYTHST